MKRYYWIVEDNGGQPVESYLITLQSGAEEITEAARFPGAAPHRVFHLVEASRLEIMEDHRDKLDREVDQLRDELAMREMVEPEVAILVKECHEIACDRVAASCAKDVVVEALKLLKPHQLRACGIEVDE